MPPKGIKTGIEEGPKGIVSNADPNKMQPLQLQSIIGRMAHYAEFLASETERNIAAKEQARFEKAPAARKIPKFDITAAIERLNQRHEPQQSPKTVDKPARARSR